MVLNRILIVTIMFAIIIIVILFLSCKKNEGFKSVSWDMNECKYVMADTMKNIFKEYSFNKNEKDSKLFLPCNYDNIQAEIDKIKVKNGVVYFIIDGCDKMVAKNSLWDHVSKTYGVQRANILLPTTYLLTDPEEIKRFTDEYDKNKLYIIKKNIQRQEGLKITNDYNEIINGNKEKYVVVQELLQNPYTINGRKADMRFYVLVVCKNKKINVFVHEEGFMYYSRKNYENKSKDSDVNITSGYIDRKVYTTNPLTHGDLRKYLDKKDRKLNVVEKEIKENNNIISQIYFNRIYGLIKNVFSTFDGHIGTCDKMKNNLCFQLFGVDVSMNENLNPKILEINKGPDIDAKDDRDAKIKHTVMRDILNLVGCIDEIKDRNGFIKVY